MIQRLKRLLYKGRQERKKPGGFTPGFTLIELLVAVLISGVIITPVLGLVISLLNSDRQEQVKGRGEQELQAALDYIARDLQQAIFIYDTAGVTQNGTAGIADDLPTVTGGTPVLVFWKRKLLARDSNIDHDGDGDTADAIKVGCLNKLPAGTPATVGRDCGAGDRGDDRDYFVFSLVAYYLIDDPGGKWSEGMRIARWEINDGITNNDPNNTDAIAVGGISYRAVPDSGFVPFDLQAEGDNTAQKMNRWDPDETMYDISPQVLVDFIDDNTSLPTPNCGNNEQTIPDFTTVASNFRTASFYVCVPTATPTNSDPPRKPVAEVHLRGNALHRIGENPEYKDHKAAFFPRSSIRVQGVGFVN